MVTWILGIILLCAGAGCLIVGVLIIPLTGWADEKEKQLKRLRVQLWLITAAILGLLAFLAHVRLLLPFIGVAIFSLSAMIVGKALLKLIQLFNPWSKDKPKNKPTIIKLNDGEMAEVIEDEQLRSNVV